MEMTTHDLVILANLMDRDVITKEQMEQAVEFYIGQLEGK